MNDCIEHSGAVNGSGYGSVHHDGKRMGAHVRAFILAHGAVPSGKVVMHSCNNRSCVNPAHLSAGTQSQNILDAVAQGRMPHCTAAKPHIQLERNPAAKLTNDEVAGIRRQQQNYKYGQDSQLARQFGVTPKVIRDIRKGHTWTSLNSE